MQVYGPWSCSWNWQKDLRNIWNFITHINPIIVAMWEIRITFQPPLPPFQGSSRSGGWRKWSLNVPSIINFNYSSVNWLWGVEGWGEEGEVRDNLGEKMHFSDGGHVSFWVNLGGRRLVSFKVVFFWWKSFWFRRTRTRKKDQYNPYGPEHPIRADPLHPVFELHIRCDVHFNEMSKIIIKIKMLTLL